MCRLKDHFLQKLHAMLKTKTVGRAPLPGEEPEVRMLEWEGYEWLNIRQMDTTHTVPVEYVQQWNRARQLAAVIVSGCEWWKPGTLSTALEARRDTLTSADPGFKVELNVAKQLDTMAKDFVQEKALMQLPSASSPESTLDDALLGLSCASSLGHAGFCLNFINIPNMFNMLLGNHKMFKRNHTQMYVFVSQTCNTWISQSVQPRA